VSIFDFLKNRPRKSAETAKERLQILMAHERSNRSGPDFLPMMQKEILAVVAKYVSIAEDKVMVKMDRGADFSTLEVEIELPPPAAKERKRRSSPPAPSSTSSRPA
jgi:cell division topological specificity factor